MLFFRLCLSYIVCWDWPCMVGVYAVLVYNQHSFFKNEFCRKKAFYFLQQKAYTPGFLHVVFFLYFCLFFEIIFSNFFVYTFLQFEKKFLHELWGLKCKKNTQGYKSKTNRKNLRSFVLFLLFFAWISKLEMHFCTFFFINFQIEHAFSAFLRFCLFFCISA